MNNSAAAHLVKCPQKQFFKSEIRSGSTKCAPYFEILKEVVGFPTEQVGRKKRRQDKTDIREKVSILTQDFEE